MGKMIRGYPNHLGPSGQTGGNAGDCIFYNDTTFGGNPQPLCRQQIWIGMWFAVAHIIPGDEDGGNG